MIQKVHVLQKDFYEKKQDGTFYTYKGKDGNEKRYKNVKLVLDGNRVAYGGSFDMKQEERIKAFNPDAEIELDLEPVEGKTYLRFKFPKTASSFVTQAQLADVVTRLKALEDYVMQAKAGYFDKSFNHDEISLEDEEGNGTVPF